MKAVVLVGGFGTRLRPLTLAVPKQMLPVLDSTMLEFVVRELGRHGVEEVVLSLGYRPDAFVASYPDDMCEGVHLVYAQEPSPLDTAGAIRFAADHAGITDRFLAVNGDVLTDIDIAGLWRRHDEFGAEATIALTPVDDPSRYGVVPIDDRNRVLEFVEKPPPGTEPSNWINAGIYVLEPSVLARIDPGRRVSIERETFPRMAAEGTLYAVHCAEYWIDAGTPESYLQAQLDLMDGRRGTPRDGVSPGAEIAPGALVEHSVIGEGVVVEQGAVIRESLVMARTRIGRDALLDRALVGEGAVVGSGSRLSDHAVVGHDEKIDSGSMLEHRTVPPPEEWE
ncbi:MAG: UTP--glucose-1-phosphate uridylyltransferase [Acidimicrobiales bacterium]|nr:MAG: NDP-sugar synthase [Actinomycetota bacterium]MBV6509840.1 UTP--glucose-1-phosphate uridylyltransferase [Acidimicrobiales bacterium]RIK03402.1 MAG: mannose-1-phosphate guanylyltransferase [Acidobacteriota bacterium]